MSAEVKKTNQEKREGFEKTVKPLIKWLNDNYNPYTKIIVDCDSAEIVSGEMSMRTTEFILD